METRPIRCPYCGGEIYVEVDAFGPMIRCDARGCGADWTPTGEPMNGPTNS